MSSRFESMPSAIGGSFADAVRRALQRVTWRTVAVTLAISAAFQAWVVVELADLYPTLSVGLTHLSAGIINVLMAFSIMLSTLVADEKVAQGAKRLPAYAAAVIIGSAIGAAAQWQVHRWLHLAAITLDAPSSNPIYDISRNFHQPAVDITQPAVMFFEFLIWGSIIVSIYVVRRTALLASERMAKAQIARANAQRRTLESRLQALQARVEPQFLFNTLGQVRDLYEFDPETASRMLGDLIAYLRAALPHLRESSSTLGQETDLISAYLNVVQAGRGERLVFDLDIPAEVRLARMPAMTLLPVVERVLIDNARAVRAPIHVVARTSGGTLRIEVACDGELPVAADTEVVLRELGDRLRGLYGSEGSAELRKAPGRGTHIAIRMPYASADRDHR